MRDMFDNPHISLFEIVKGSPAGAFVNRLFFLSYKAVAPNGALGGRDLYFFAIKR